MGMPDNRWAALVLLAKRPEMALRFDLTVPLARYVAQHEHQLNFPFRRYQIQRVYRGESKIRKDAPEWVQERLKESGQADAQGLSLVMIRRWSSGFRIGPCLWN